MHMNNRSVRISVIMTHMATFFYSCLYLLTANAQATIDAGPDEALIYERPVQEQRDWRRSAESLLWNFHNMYQPCVIEIQDDAYPYRMWFFGWATADGNPDIPGCDAIYHARSSDLAHWEVWCGNDQWDTEMEPAAWAPVLAASDRYYDAWHNGDPAVVYHDGRYYMAYSATSKPYYKKSHDHLDGQLLCIMGAVSDNGIHWQKTEQPLLIESDVAKYAETTDEHICDFHRPSLMRHEGKWKLWFDYWNHPGGVCMGYAENTGAFGDADGFQIKHDLKKAPLIKNWPNPDIVIIDGKYHAFADPVGYPPTDTRSDSSRLWSSRALCEAVSDDGLHWRIVGYIPPDQDTAACHVPQALVTTIAGERRLYLFYATQRGGGPVYDFRYDRIRAIWRSL